MASTVNQRMPRAARDSVGTGERPREPGSAGRTLPGCRRARRAARMAAKALLAQGGNHGEGERDQADNDRKAHEQCLEPPFTVHVTPDHRDTPSFAAGRWWRAA